MVYVQRSASSESDQDSEVDPSTRTSPYPALNTIAMGSSSSASSSIALRPLSSARATFYAEERLGSNEAHAQRFSTTVRFAGDSSTNEFQRALFSINQHPEHRTNIHSYDQRPLYARAPLPPLQQQQQSWGYHEEEEVKSSVWDGQQEEVAAVNERRRAAPVFSFFVPPPISIPSATTASSAPSAGPAPRQQMPTPRVRPITNASRDITFNMLRPHFNRPLQEAAGHFGVCTTLLKKICRKNGIAKWPYRHICGLHKSIASLKQQVQYFDGKEKKSYAEQLRKLEIDLESHQQTGTEPTQDFIESLGEGRTQSASIANEFQDEEEKSRAHGHAADVTDQGGLEFRGPSTAHDPPDASAVNWRPDANFAARNNQLQNERNPDFAAPGSTASASIAPPASIAPRPSLPSLSSLLNRSSPRHQDEFY